jgi:dTDP-4-dehydrorhamnose reductase
VLFRSEPGAFDIRGFAPRPTAIARMARALAKDGRYEHPLVRLPGWWRRPERLWYPADDRFSDVPSPSGDVPPILVTGKTGTLGRAFARMCELRGLPVRLVSRSELDIADPNAVDRMLARLRPWAVVNAAGYVRVDDAEAEPARCVRENVEGPATLARGCRAAGVRLVTFSSDLVFNGEKRARYVEADEPGPLGVYGRTKVEAEQRVLAADPDALVIRTSAFFGPWDAHNFVTQAIRSLAAGMPFRAASDSVVSPTYVPDLVNASLDLLIDGEHGVWHVANDGEVTWAGLAAAAARAAGIPRRTLVPTPTEALGLRATRPAYSALGSEKGGLLAPLPEALGRYVDDVQAA